MPGGPLFSANVLHHRRARALPENHGHVRRAEEPFSALGKLHEERLGYFQTGGNPEERAMTPRPVVPGQEPVVGVPDGVMEELVEGNLELLQGEVERQKAHTLFLPSGVQGHLGALARVEPYGSRGRAGIRFPRTGCLRGRRRRIRVQAEPAHISAPPLFLGRARPLHVIEALSGLRAQGPHPCRFETFCHHPTVPVISSSIRRFSSTAYSIGSCLTSGSRKPLTIMREASCSLIPLLMR